MMSQLRRQRRDVKQHIAALLDRLAEIFNTDRQRIAAVTTNAVTNLRAKRVAVEPLEILAAMRAIAVEDDAARCPYEITLALYFQFRTHGDNHDQAVNRARAALDVLGGPEDAFDKGEAHVAALAPARDLAFISGVLAGVSEAEQKHG